jgi:hypothetical protein
VTKMPRTVAIVSIVAGAIRIILGGITYYIVHRELSDEHIVVSQDAKPFIWPPALEALDHRFSKSR